jgi:hypothetical protein
MVLNQVHDQLNIIQPNCEAKIEILSIIALRNFTLYEKMFCDLKYRCRYCLYLLFRTFFDTMNIQQIQGIIILG